MSSRNGSKVDDDDDDEEDYMSAAFVDESLNQNSTLLWSRKHQVDHQRYKKKLLSNPQSKRSIAEMEADRREEALAKPIESANKGFRLLQKMMSRGSSASSSAPTTTAPEAQLSDLIAQRAPITVDLKADRLGLGHSSASATKRLKRSSRTSDKPEDINRRFAQTESEFLAARRSQTEAHITRKDYFKCQQVCANLESAANKTAPDVDWYWPPALLEALKKSEDDDEAVEEVQDEEEEKEEEPDYVERLRELNGHLRGTHHYCIWCAVHFDSAEDLATSCPGDTRADHDE